MKYLVLNILLVLIIFLFIPYIYYLDCNYKYTEKNKEFFIVETPENAGFFIYQEFPQSNITYSETINNTIPTNNIVFPIKYTTSNYPDFNVVQEEIQSPVISEVKPEITESEVQLCNLNLDNLTKQILSVKDEQSKASSNLLAQQQLQDQQSDLQNTIILQEYKTQLNSIQNQNKKAQKTLSSIKNEFNICTSSVKNFNNNYTQTNTCCSNQMQNVADTKLKIFNNCTTAQASLNNQLAILNNKIISVQQEINQITNNNNALTNQINSCNKDLNDLQTKINNC